MRRRFSSGRHLRAGQHQEQAVLDAQQPEVGQHAALGAAMAAELAVGVGELAHVVADLALQEVRGLGAADGDQAEVRQVDQRAGGLSGARPNRAPRRRSSMMLAPRALRKACQSGFIGSGLPC
jgi:hypothetical protein